MCPICHNKDKMKLLQNINIEVSNELITNKTSYININKIVFDNVNYLLKTKCHSSAYLKLCALNLEELGEFELANKLNEVAYKKLEIEKKKDMAWV